MSVDCRLCGEVTDESLAEHLADRHLNVMVHIDLDLDRGAAGHRAADRGLSIRR